MTYESTIRHNPESKNQKLHRKKIMTLNNVFNFRTSNLYRYNSISVRSIRHPPTP